jgi:FixJ family two-component response regulator
MDVLAPKVVMVVDDDPGIQKAIRRLLHAHGLDSESYLSAEDFRSRADLNKASCLVLDIDLNGSSGIELARILYAGGATAPAIFITGNSSDATRKAARDVGGVAYLTKPFLATCLLAALSKATGVP